MSARPPQDGGAATVLHYVGYDRDAGGIVSVIRTLAEAGRFACLIGVNPGFRQARAPALGEVSFPRVAGERIGAADFWRARAVAREARRWLAGGRDRIFHAHSRAGLLAAWWLQAAGERRFVASVRCFGRQRWFYRAAARRLGPRLRWLGPAMKRHYGIADRSWENCIPDCVPMADSLPPPRPRAAGAVLRIGCVGALVPVKEWETVLRALAELPADLPAKVIHAGGEDGTPASAEYARRLHGLAAQATLAGRVEWRGAVDDMRGFYAGIDVLAVVSPWEAFSVAALEAAAAGIPVVAPDRAGTTDLIETARAGRVFRTGDPRDLARVLADVGRATAAPAFDFSESGVRRFSAATVAAQWADVYAGLVASSASSAARNAAR